MSIVLEMFIFILRRMKMKKNGNNKKLVIIMRELIQVQILVVGQLQMKITIY